MELITTEEIVRRDITDQGFAWIPRSQWSIGLQLEPHLERMRDDWDRLEPDRYLEHGAKFRLRRYGRYHWSPTNNVLTALPNEPYFQPEDENTYAGGVERVFAPLLPDTVSNPFLLALIRSTFACLPVADDKQGKTWEVRVHQIRIVASPESPANPAPEGIHQDGTDFLILHLISRHNVIGGESTIYDLDRKPIQRFTMMERLDSVIMEDPRIMHGVTSVHSADGHHIGTRDLMGLDFIYSPYLRQPA